MSNFDKAIEIIMAEPPDPRYPEYYANLLRQADVSGKDVGNCSETPNSSETIYRQAAIDAINCDITVTGRQNAEVVAATIGAFADRIKALPPAEPEVTEEAVKEYCRKRCLTILTNDSFHKLTSAEPVIRTQMSSANCISRQAAIDAMADAIWHYPNEKYAELNSYENARRLADYGLSWLQSAQPELQNSRVFQWIIVEYPSISTYPEYKGKPYFSIKYTENGQEFIGYGTYKPEVLSEYLKEYFMSSAQPRERLIAKIDVSEEQIRDALEKMRNEPVQIMPPAQPEQCEDAVPRASVEYICRKNTVSTNPYEHEYHDKFIQFMDDPEISDFGRWQHSNGFNTALVAVKCDLDKVPSAQLERKKGKWIEDSLANNIYHCSECGMDAPVEPTGGTEYKSNYCPNCGADMRGEANED